MKGTDGSIFALGDCTATSYAPTAQVASQQGAYLARCFHQMAKKDELVLKSGELEQGHAAAVLPEEKKQFAEELNKVKKQLAKLKLKPFQYSHQGSLAYIGSEKAIADLPFMNGNVSEAFEAWFQTGMILMEPVQIATGGVATFLFWRSAYISTLFSIRNRTFVAMDWLMVKLFGRFVTFY